MTPPLRSSRTARGSGLPRSIARLDISAVTVGLTEPFAISGGAPAEARNVLVRVTLRDGSVGYGEAAPFEAVTGETQDSTLAALQAVRASVTGRDAAAWRALTVDIRCLIPEAPAARCAIEQAVIDALARHAGLPLLKFFGGSSHELVTDITIPAGDISHSADSARRAVESGFGMVKVKVGAVGWETDAARVVAISQTTPGLSIMVDANAGYSHAQACQFLDRVRSAGVILTLVEQPVAANDIESMAALEKEFGVPVCADESVRSPADAMRVARTGGISLINIKLMKCGVADALDIISVARSAGMSCMIGGMIETSVSMTFSAALAMANHPLFAYIDLDTPLFMRDSIIRGGMTYDGSFIQLPADAAGSGIDASGYFPI